MSRTKVPDDLELTANRSGLLFVYETLNVCFDRNRGLYAIVKIAVYTRIARDSMIISGYHVCNVLFLDFIKLDQWSTEGTFGTFQDQIFQYW